MSDVVSCFEVERDVAGGEHRVTVYVDATAPGVRMAGGFAVAAIDLTAEQADTLADILHIHAEPALCWRCGRYPSMPNDLCPRCLDADDERRSLR